MSMRRALQRRGVHHSSAHTPPQWRTLFELLERLEALPTATARACWLQRLLRERPSVGAALLQLIKAGDQAEASGFLGVPAIDSSELRLRVEALSKRVG